MKAAGGSAAGLVLASGQFSIAELYRLDFAIATLPALYLTTHDAPLTVAGNTYATSLLVSRSSIEQRVGVESQQVTLDLSDHTDGTAATIAGLSFIQACRLGYLDSCRIWIGKLFMATPGDTSAGAVPWFQGRVSEVTCDRMKATLQVESDLALLNIAMPRNIVQAGCTHKVFDAGCALNPASFQVSGAVTGVNADRTQITSGLAQANDYFNLGVLTFTSGVLNGLSRTVKSSRLLGGQVVFMNPLPLAPSIGDTFTVLPGCDKKQATCSAKFSNLAHFRGYPYVPTPETLYGGGTAPRNGRRFSDQFDHNLGSPWGARRPRPGH